MKAPRRTLLRGLALVGCPETSSPVVLRVASLLGQIDTRNTLIEQELLEDLYARFRQAWTYRPHGIECARCRFVARRHAHWLELGADLLEGPWCHKCLRYKVWALEGEGMREDLRVFVIPATLATRKVLDEEPQPTPEMGNDPALLF